ncbi:MAG: DUF4340 domain-containing protein [Deltaproteobacteria bacterium]|nr:DUF4340 domain-containing protein [Deltaproteobacteria bacterium]
MKRSESLIYGVLLVLTLGAAWMVRNAEEPTDDSGAVVYDPGPSGIKSMAWEDETSVATIEVSGTDDDVTTWIVAGKKEKIETEVEPAGDDDDSAGPKGDDDSAEAETTQPAKPEVVVTYGDAKLRRFPGNATAKKLVESFSPLEALREFDGLDADSLAQMGLDEPKGSFTIESTSGSVTFQIGEKAYGSSDTYVKLAGKDSVFLVASKDLSPLRGAENRLVERVLLTAEAADVASATVLVGGAPAGPKRLHQGRHDKANSFWAAEASPEDKDSVFGGFVDKVLGLRASSYPTDDEAPDEAALSPLFAVQFEGEAGSLGTVELGRMVDDAKSTEDEVAYAYFARSDRTRNRWAAVSKTNATDLEDQVSQVIE